MSQTWSIPLKSKAVYIWAYIALIRFSVQGDQNEIGVVMRVRLGRFSDLHMV